MPYEPIPELFPNEIWYEPSVFGVGNNHPSLPADNYDLVEAYCTDENCDCRRVFINVFSRKSKMLLAVIAYGWETKTYYQKWFGGRDDKLSKMAIEEMMGPVLNSASPQSELAPALLGIVQGIIKKDPNFVARLKRHYKIFKEKVDPKHFGKPSVFTDNKAEKKETPLRDKKPRKRSRRRTN